MPKPPRKSKPAKQKTTRPPKKRIWNHLHLIALLVAMSFFLTLFIGVLLFAFISLDIPDVNSLAAYKPPVSTVILDDHGDPIDTIYTQNRTVIGLDEMPDLLPRAFIAAEDARFYNHKGLDGWSILRALIHNIIKGERSQGGSTITQQVARSLLLTPEKTYSRKIKEAILAYRIDKVLRKNEILHIYLNQIYLGAGAYGVEAAAQTFFGKHVKELNLAEIALLAGLPQAPSRYSPFNNLKLTKKRQAYVLNRMAEDGYISATAAQKAFKQILLWGPKSQADPKAFAYFIQHVRNYVEQKYGAQLLTSGGLTIHTTMNQALQKAADRAANRGIKAWQKRHKSITEPATPEAALIALDTQSGQVKAVTGGTDFSKTQFNRAIQARRQPGSAFKPLIYAAALLQGFTPASLIVDEPIALRGNFPGKTWKPRNFSNKFYGPTTLRDGIVYSRNIVTIKVLQQIGISRAIQLARHFGITSPLTEDLSLALGSSGISLLELTSAYSIFANKGLFGVPIFITKIIDRHGNIIEENTPERVQVLDSRTAYQITRLLEGVIREGTGKKASGLGIPAAGKTGTTDRNMDAWFIGYTAKLAAGVWMGFDQQVSLGKRETGGIAAAPVWLDFMLAAKKRIPAGDFTIPEGIVLKSMDLMTGVLDSDESDKISVEAFKEENLPLHVGVENEKAIPTNGGNGLE